MQATWAKANGWQRKNPKLILTQRTSHPKWSQNLRQNQQEKPTMTSSHRMIQGSQTLQARQGRHAVRQGSLHQREVRSLQQREVRRLQQREDRVDHARERHDALGRSNIEHTRM